MLRRHGRGRRDCSRRLFELLLLWAFVCGASACPSAAAQEGLACRETFGFYERQGYVVRGVRVRPLLRFIPAGAELREALAAADAELRPTGAGLRAGGPFSLAGLSALQTGLSVQLEGRLLKGRTGFAYLVPRLRHCDGGARPPTLDVEYLLLTASRPSYLTNSFERGERGRREREAAGGAASGGAAAATSPYVGYNDSRGLYAGAALAYRTRLPLAGKLALDVSGSGSSAVADASVSGARAFDSGPLAYAEWRLGYKYSSVRADTFRRAEATVLGQFFGASRPLGGGDSFLRFGASVEGGNRQTDLPQGALPASDPARSGHGAVKLYAGGTVSRGRHDWKASYGLQLGNSGRGLRPDYLKQIFDTAYKARFVPRASMPVQFDVRLTAGRLDRVSGGEIPVAERFFGGNVEREFIQGDAWRISAEPFIRSFAQHRLNRAGPAPGVGGESFASFNLTIAQTIWGRPVVPPEISRDPALASALAGQLLTTRRVLREGSVQGSAQLGQLRVAVNKLTPALDKLTTELAALRGAPQLPGGIAEIIGKFFEADPETGAAPIPDAEDAVAAAVLDASAGGAALADEAAVAGFLNNPVEASARALVEGDPDSYTEAIITLIRGHVAALRRGLGEAGLGERARALDEPDAELEKVQAGIRGGLSPVNRLRAYAPDEIGRVLGRLNERAPSSGRSLGQILADVRRQTGPLLEGARRELRELPAAGGDRAAVRQRAEVSEFVALLDAVDTYAASAAAALDSANDFADKRQFDEAKFDVESLAVGFGGAIPSHLAGVARGVAGLRGPLAERGLASRWAALRDDARDILAVRRGVKSDFGGLRVPAAEAEANQTVDYVGRVLGVFFRELNIVGVSPVFMFDAARLGPPPADGRAGFRYGVGAGVRFSLVNLDFTAGYSANPARRPGEARGAFVFNMEVSDLFR